MLKNFSQTRYHSSCPTK